MAVSPKWKTRGDKYACRHWLGRCLWCLGWAVCLQEMAWRWPVLNITALQANKRVNQTVRSQGAQIKMSKPCVTSPGELIRHHALFPRCQSFFSHLMNGLNIKGRRLEALAGHYHQTTLYERSYGRPFLALFRPPASKNPIIQKNTNPYCSLDREISCHYPKHQQ